MYVHRINQHKLNKVTHFNSVKIKSFFCGHQNTNNKINLIETKRHSRAMHRP